MYIYGVIQWNSIQPLKEKESLPFAATWMKLEGVILNVTCQTEKDKHCMGITYMRNQKKKERNREESGGCRGLGEGNREMEIKACELSVVRSMSSDNLVYSILTFVNNTGLNT